MKTKHILITIALLGAAYYAYTLISNKKKTKVIKDRSFEIEIEESPEEKAE